MEKDIKKGLIYGFLFGVAIAILFIKHYEIIADSDGNEINYLGVFDYLIIIIKRGIVGSFSGAMIAFIIFKLNSSLKLTKKNENWCPYFWFMRSGTGYSIFSVFKIK